MPYSGNVVQKSRKTVYDTGQSCACGSCSAFSQVIDCSATDNIKDWSLGLEKCCFSCPDKRICARPDPEECDIGINENQENPYKSVTWNSKAPNLTCFYDVSKMNSLNVIQNYRSKFGETEDYNSMMENFCSGLGKKCVTDPDTGQPFKQCCKLNSADDEGDACRIWYNKQPASTQDSTVTNFCFKYENSPDCKCINRSRDPVYNTVKKHSPFNDGCWYAPCASRSKYLVSNDLKTPTCPGNVCQIVLESLQNNNVDIDNVKNTINCTFPPPPSPPSPIVPPINPISPPTKKSNNSVIFIVIFIIILIGAGIYLTRKKN